ASQTKAACLVALPNLLGSLLFFVSSFLMVCAEESSLVAWQPRRFWFWCAALFNVGALAFTASSALSFPSLKSVPKWVPRLLTVCGELLFLVGSIASVFQSSEDEICRSKRTPQSSCEKSR